MVMDVTTGSLTIVEGNNVKLSWFCGFINESMILFEYIVGITISSTSGDHLYDFKQYRNERLRAY